VVTKLARFIRQDGLTVAIVVILIVTYALLRTTGDSFASAAELETRLTSSPMPTVVEFYSNTCSICLISKPTVDRLEEELRGQAQVLRLNVKDEVANALAYRWGVRGVPTFFILDATGSIVYAQAGAPDVAALKNTVAKLNIP
jgi:thiol-disulfide isomerase/thioredoxin